MTLLCTFAFLCVSIKTKSTTIVGCRELASFHGVLPHKIWVPVTLFYGNTWQILYAVIFPTQFEIEKRKSHRPLQVLTKILLKRSTKTSRIVYASYWLGKRCSFWTSFKFKKPTFTSSNMHPWATERNEAFRIKTFNIWGLSSTPV